MKENKGEERKNIHTIEDGRTEGRRENKVNDEERGKEGRMKDAEGRAVK